MIASLRRASFYGTIGILGSVAAGAANAENFYAGKTVSFVLGFDVGGGFGVYARTIANHLPRFIPGHPTIVSRIMPGAGSNIAGAYLYSVAPRDGTTIGAVMANAILSKLMDGSSKARFEPTEFLYLAGAERGTRLCTTFHTSKIKTYEDALRHKTVLGATAPGGSTRDYAEWHRRTTGAKFDIVSGYKGTAALYLAMERGEIDGICGVDWTAIKSQRAELLRDKKLNLLVQDGLEPEPELAALGVPQTWPFIRTASDRRAVRLIVGFQQAFGKAYLAPPAVPAERVEILRRAFADTMRDPKFLAEAKSVRIDIKPQSGESIQRAVNELYTAPKEILERIKEIQAP